jgi:hypothetical protein
MDQTASEVLEEARGCLDRGNPCKPTAIERIASELASARQEAITHRSSDDPTSPEAVCMAIEQIRATLESLNAAIRVIVTGNMQTMATLSRLAAALTPPEQTNEEQADPDADVPCVRQPDRPRQALGGLPREENR